MARPVRGQLLRPLLLAVCCLLLLQVSECSRPSPWLGDDHVADALHHHHQLLILDAEARTAARPPTSTEEVAGDGRTGATSADDDAAHSSPASATPARAVGTFVASSWPRQTSDRALGRMLLRSKLARRFLAGAGVGVDEAGSATDGTGASCHSYNPHINCPPAGKP